ncbi:MAG: phosphate acyltransferase PlsX [Anaerolineales bacterium]|nr:phosphate acyltransferase PlsX [Anaerolineales bacterium]
MRIVLDAMGSDTCPDPEIEASLEAADLFGDEIILVGPADRLESKLKQKKPVYKGVRVVDATDVITMQDKGLALALKAKRKNSKTSMAIGMDLVQNKEADAFVTAGNTGGALATAFFRLGVIPGVERPALSGLFPVKGGHCVVLDIGANPDCKPEHLLQFAIMGSIYAEKVLGKSKAKIAILSNGEEPGKGNSLVKEAFPLLETSGLNFIGNVEGKELFGGETDVAVTDGFTGNILLKSSEAVAKLITDILKEQMMKSMRTQIGGLLAKPAFKEIKRLMDPGEVGAAPLLGIDGLVFIGHGRSDTHALVSAIRVARQAVSTNLLVSIHDAIQQQMTVD